jgi:hypothetical protein
MASEYSSPRIPFIRSPLVSVKLIPIYLGIADEFQGSGTEHPADDEHPEIAAHDDTLFDNPQFQHYEETSNIQLFYDLFFVANLTSFTNIHEVNSLDSKSRAGKDIGGSEWLMYL